MDKNAIFAMLFPLGTLEATSKTTWSWTLCAHVDKVKEAGVEFDPEARTLTSVQGIASSGSALQVCHVLQGAQIHSSCGCQFMCIIRHNGQGWPGPLTGHNLMLVPSKYC